MVWVRALAGLALATSLAANAYLLLHRNARAATATTQASASAESRNAKPALHEKSKAVAEPLLPVPPDLAKLDRASLEKRLATAEATLEPLLPIYEKFERADRAPEYELQLQPQLDEVFGVQPGAEPNYELECRGHYCKLESEESSIDWRMEVQSGEFAGQFKSILVGESVYVELADNPERAPGLKLVIQIFQSLSLSPLMAACKTQHPEPGVIELALRLDTATRRLSVVATGSLADKPGGRCIRKVLDDIIATTAVPPDVTTILEQPIPVQVP